MPIKCRSLKAIVDEHAQVSTSPLDLPGYATTTLGKLPGIELASDFIICDPDTQQAYNDFLHTECPAASPLWTVFAASGQGDFWLLGRTENQVGYYEHNDENLSLKTIKNMGISIEDWIMLADIIHQLEAKMEIADPSPKDERETVQALSSLGIDLYKLPFSYF